MRKLTEWGDYELFERDDVASPPWRNFKLVASGSGRPKSNWWLAWNGERVAKSADAQKLEQHYPDDYAHLIEFLTALR